MIQMIRVDDRLLHGQIAYSWKAELNYEAIVIANEDAATNKLRKAALQAAKPAGVKIATRSLQDAVELLNNEKLKQLKVLVLVDTPVDAEYLYEHLEEQPKLNLGGVQSKEERVQLDKALYLNQEEMSALDRLDEKGIEINYQLVSSESAQQYSHMKK